MKIEKMKNVIQRFVNKRSIFILFVMLLLAALFHFQKSGLFEKQSHVYEQKVLAVKSDCDIIKNKCPAYGEDISVFLKLGDHPSALKAFPVQVLIEGSTNQSYQNVFVSFTMKGMSMGKHQKKLKWNKNSSRWQGMVILPICATGRRDWHVSVEVVGNDVIYDASYNFVLQK